MARNNIGSSQSLSDQQSTLSGRPSSYAWPGTLMTCFCEHVLPIRGVKVTLKATCEINTRFQHTHALTAWLRRLVADSTTNKDGHSEFEWMRIDAVESGHVHYGIGDHYHFNIFCTVAGLQIFTRLLERLGRQSGESSTGVNAAIKHVLAFDNHWKLHELRDFFSDRTIQKAEDLSLYDFDSLMKEAAIWQAAFANAPVIWQWISPARILKNKASKGSGENRFCRDAEDINVSLLFERCADSLSKLTRRMTEAVPKRDTDSIPTALEQHHDVFWIQDDYHPDAAAAKPKGGLLGRHRLHADVSLDWACVLVACQYIGVGQGTVSGLGRFRLETPAGKVSLQRGHASLDWLDRSLAPENLHEAWRHVRESRQSVPSDAQTLSQLDGNGYPEEADHDSQGIFEDSPSQTEAATLLEILDGRIKKLRNRCYVAPSANACLLPKSDGSSRMLAIPPFWDAVLQRAVAQQLAPSLDSLMHPASFGYRRGRSRRSAAEAIQRARREGYRWVYDADIEDFFGSVDHNKLHVRLLALFDDDPIIDVLMNWVRAPVRWNDVEHPRKQGLPQGSNLSPLLANLMLDDFDNDMSAAGIRLVRFADDFVLLCKSQELAAQASQTAARSLSEHGFNLHEGKSRIADLDAGMDFLGYLFINDYAIDTSGNRVIEPTAKKSSSRAQQLPAEQKLQIAHWLAKLSQTTPRALTTRELEAREAGKALSTIGDYDALAVDEQFDADGSLYLVGHGHSVYTEGGHLVVAHEDKRVLQRPWQHLKHVFLMGNQHITTPALTMAARQGVNVYKASASGHLHFSVSKPPSPADQRLWLIQACVAEDLEFCLPIARMIVASRIRHQTEVLRQRIDPQNDGKAATTTSLLRELNEAKDFPSINGIEGLAAAGFFEQFAALLPENLGFTVRARRPPPDPVNALLSIGYQTLYAHADSFLKAERLLPAFGIYHRSGRNHAALASDMIEPFRHLVEQSVLQLFRRNSLNISDFVLEDTGKTCIVLPAARRRFVADLHSRLAKSIKPLGETEAIPYRTLLHRQCHSMALAIEHRDPERFTVFRKR